MMNEKLEKMARDEFYHNLSSLSNDTLCDSALVSVELFKIVAPDVEPYIKALTDRIKQLEGVKGKHRIRFDLSQRHHDKWREFGEWREGFKAAVFYIGLDKDVTVVNAKGLPIYIDGQTCGPR